MATQLLHVGTLPIERRPSHVLSCGKVVPFGRNEAWPLRPDLPHVTCVVPQHPNPCFWAHYECDEMRVLVFFCSRDCVNAFELDPRLVLGLERAVLTKRS